MRDAPQLPAVSIPGGRAEVGTRQPLLPADGEGPVRRVTLRPFRISPTAVSNAQFARFVAATGYVTEAEEIGWSAVFFRHLHPDAEARPGDGGAPDWWAVTAGACWRCPEGGASSTEGREDHPAVHLSLRDAEAFAAWAGGRLPTEAEWEHAARGGLTGATYPWGDREPDDDAYQPCNIWQGDFPRHDTARDGYSGTCPVDTFAPNGYGLFNMVGNTWEWCADRFRIRSLAKPAQRRNAAAAASGARVLKGGSFLCHRSYCHRYRIAARSPAPPDTATSHLGARVVFDAS